MDKSIPMLFLETPSKGGHDICLCPCTSFLHSSSISISSPHFPSPSSIPILSSYCIWGVLALTSITPASLSSLSYDFFLLSMWVPVCDQTTYRFYVCLPPSLHNSFLHLYQAKQIFVHTFTAFVIHSFQTTCIFQITHLHCLELRSLSFIYFVSMSHLYMLVLALPCYHTVPFYLHIYHSTCHPIPKKKPKASLVSLPLCFHASMLA